MRRLALVLASTMFLGGSVVLAAPAGACPVPENPHPLDPCSGELRCIDLPVIKEGPCPL
jgi:hypothetical protein